MAKNKISEYSSVAANNVDIGGINIAEGCAPSGINNAIRELMAQLKDQQTGTDADNFTVGGDLSVTGNASITGGLSVTGAVTLSNALSVTSGGTGFSSVTTGDILYASASNTLAKLAGASTTEKVLLSGVSAPSWGKVNLETAVSGTLPIANGGTGLTGVGTSGQILTSDGSVASWQTPETPIGVGQTWQDVASSRSVNTDYTNNTGRPIAVSVRMQQVGSGSATLVVDGVTIAGEQQSGVTGSQTIGGIIPNGAVYRVNSSNNIANWAELR